MFVVVLVEVSPFWVSAAGSEKRTVEVKNYLPANMVPNTAVERMLTISGKINAILLITFFIVYFYHHK